MQAPDLPEAVDRKRYAIEKRAVLEKLKNAFEGTVDLDEYNPEIILGLPLP
ncbi:MAG: hypothetical protein HQ517_01240 [SAR324 cluster bacterium]|nr:hypothetical protein [SAR324 cluster bacterium]